MNTMFSMISPESVVDTYKQVRKYLHGYDIIIFNAMKSVDSRFVIPVSTAEYERKHEEIVSTLNYSEMTNGYDKACLLFEKIWTSYSCVSVGELAHNLLELIKFSTQNIDTFIKLTEDMRWDISTKIQLDYRYDSEILLEQIDRTNGWNEIVPSYIVEYILSSINAFKQGMNTVAAALLSIAVEATLRDILATRGYTFEHSAANVDIFSYTCATIAQESNHYTITLNEAVPKQTSEFNLINATSKNLEVKLRRVINKRKNRLDINMLCAPDLIDYWTKDTIETPKEKTVSGLGEALRIARNEEKILTTSDLPLDVDEVITGVRNNLVHLSGKSLNQVLRILNITLKEFLDNKKSVYYLVATIPRFINDQYLRLKKEGF